MSGTSGLYKRNQGIASSIARKEARNHVKEWVVSKFDGEPEPCLL